MDNMTALGVLFGSVNGVVEFLKTVVESLGLYPSDEKARKTFNYVLALAVSIVIAIGVVDTVSLFEGGMLADLSALQGKLLMGFVASFGSKFTYKFVGFVSKDKPASEMTSVTAIKE